MEKKNGVDHKCFMFFRASLASAQWDTPVLVQESK